MTYSIGEETGEAEIGPLSVLERGYRAPLIVNGEPTNLRVAPATMGWFFFRITIEGKSLHPAARYTAIYPRPGTSHRQESMRLRRRARSWMRCHTSSATGRCTSTTR